MLAVKAALIVAGILVLVLGVCAALTAMLGLADVLAAAVMLAIAAGVVVCSATAFPVAVATALAVCPGTPLGKNRSLAVGIGMTDLDTLGFESAEACASGEAGALGGALAVLDGEALVGLERALACGVEEAAADDAVGLGSVSL